MEFMSHFRYTYDSSYSTYFLEYRPTIFPHFMADWMVLIWPYSEELNTRKQQLQAAPCNI